MRMKRILASLLAAAVAVSAMATTASALTAELPDGTTVAEFQGLTTSTIAVSRGSTAITIPSVYGTPEQALAGTAYDASGKASGYKTVTKSIYLTGDESAKSVWDTAENYLDFYLSGTTFDLDEAVTLEIIAVSSEKRDASYTIGNAYSDYKYAGVYSYSAADTYGGAAIPQAAAVAAFNYKNNDANYTAIDFPVVRLDFIFEGLSTSDSRVDDWATRAITDYTAVLPTTAVYDAVDDAAAGADLDTDGEMLALTDAVAAALTQAAGTVDMGDPTTGLQDTWALDATQAAEYAAVVAAATDAVNAQLEVIDSSVTVDNLTEGDVITLNSVISTIKTELAKIATSATSIYNANVVRFLNGTNQFAGTGVKGVSFTYNNTAFYRYIAPTAYALHIADLQKTVIGNLGAYTVNGVAGTVKAKDSLTFTQTLIPEEATYDFWVKNVVRSGGVLSYDISTGPIAGRDYGTLPAGVTFKVNLVNELDGRLTIASSGAVAGVTVSDIAKFLGTANAKAIEIVVSNSTYSDANFGLLVSGITYSAYPSDYVAPAVVEETTTTAAETTTTATPADDDGADADPVDTAAAALVVIPAALSAVATVIAKKAKKSK